MEHLIKETDSLFPGKVGFLLYFQPKSEREMRYLFAKERDFFNYPVFMDLKSEINRLNSFPREMEYQCFLLDKDNKVLMIGNPTLNPQVWDLYKSEITGEKNTRQKILTTIKTDKESHNYGTIRKGNSNPVVFHIENTGNEPLVISHVSTTCGCTSVDWDKYPVASGDTVSVRVEMTPDEIGYFSKTITVYCNIKESALKFTIQGEAID